LYSDLNLITVKFNRWRKVK